MFGARTSGAAWPASSWVAVGLTVLAKLADVPLAVALLLVVAYPLALIPLRFYLPADARGSGASCRPEPRRETAAPPPPPLRNHAVDLEDLGVLAVDVDAVRAGDVPDVLGVRVAPVLLRRVLASAAIFRSRCRRSSATYAW